MELEQLETMAQVIERIAATRTDGRLVFNFRDGFRDKREMCIDLHLRGKEHHILIQLPEDAEERAARIQHTITTLYHSLSKAGID
jgi:hypothetical protein